MKACITYVLAASLMAPAGARSAQSAAQPQTSSKAPQSSAKASQPAAKPPTPARAAAEPVDGGWPRAFTSSSGARIVLYEPQVASWDDQKRIVMYAAVSYAPKDEKSTALGTLRIEANTLIATAERLVSFSEFVITSANFPTLPREQLTAVVNEITTSVPREARLIALDRVLAAVDAGQIKPKNIEGIKTDPPVIYFSERPAILVNIDGEPIWSPIKDNDLRFAVNTNWDLFEQPASKTYYLRMNHAWASAPSVDGPWTSQATLPASFSKLPDDENWKEVRAALPPRKDAEAAHLASVFVSKVPAELILLKGPAAYSPVKGTKLQWVNNTGSDIFRIGTDGPIYYLVSGRWFTASAFSGPWTFATPNLPDDFKRIPLDHPRSRVLAAVPGTTQALEAVLLAQVPQTARVSRSAVTAPDVVYQGAPQFEPIEQTTVARAVNTDKDIIKVGDMYYMCFDGVWFMGKSPQGPWTVADAVPDQIYEIPISSPAYDVTAVTVDSYDDDAVVFATAAAYTGLMVGWGVAMWGTGYYYPPYYWGGGYYPVYYGHYPSYGYGASYNPWTGAYTRAGGVYGPYGGAGYAARYNPRTGTYSRGAAAYGPGGARGAAQAWNPRTGTYAQTRQGSNVYGSWGSTGVQRGDQWAKTSRVTNRATGNTTRVTQGSGGGSSISRRGADGRTTVGKTGGGNMYAGHDGNVYRNQGGSWQKFDNGGWNNVDRPVGTSGRTGDLAGRADSGLSPATRDQLNRDRASRADGAKRTSDFSKFKGSSRGSGSYRPSGGFSGGGGFRGGGGGFRGGGGGGRRR